MKKHNILWYYIFTLICAIVFGGTAGVLFDTSITEQYAISMTLIQMSPLCGLIFVCLFSKDWSFIKNLHWNPFKSMKNIQWVVLSVLIPTVIITCSAYILSAMGKTYVPNGYNGKEITVIVIASALGCVGEEIGWRGFMLPAYNKKYSLFISAVYTGMLWGTWHFGKISLYGISGYLLFILMITEFSIIMAWIYSKTNKNLVCMMLFHLSINITSMLLLTEREGILFYLVGCTVSAIICMAVFLIDRKEFAVLASNEEID